jgi:hypothetical protein
LLIRRTGFSGSAFFYLFPNKQNNSLTRLWVYDYFCLVRKAPCGAAIEPNAGLFVDSKKDLPKLTKETGEG